MFTVYLIVNQLDEKYYVGKTTMTLHKRWLRHLGCARRGENTYLFRAIRKYGPKRFSISFLCEAKNAEELNYLEILWISRLDAKNTGIGYNMTDGGDGRCGIKDGPETCALKKKLAAGRTFTPQAKARQKEVRATMVGEKSMRFKKEIKTTDIISLYHGGRSSRQIASLLGTEKSLVTDRLRKSGESVRLDSKELRRKRLEEKGKLHLLEFNDSELVRLYKEGWTMQRIASLYESSHRTIGKHLEKQGVFSTRQHNRMKKAA